MSVDITALQVKVVSDGISKTTADLKAFVDVADKAEKANVKLGTSAKGQADTDEKRAKSTEAFMAKLQRQVDLLGANTSQTNAYTAAMKGMTALEQNMAAMLGAEVDAYKRLATEQSLAVKANQELDQSYSKLQKEADAYYASQKKIEQGRDVEMHNARQAALKAEEESYKKLQKEVDGYYASQKKLSQSREAELHLAQQAGNLLNMEGQRNKELTQMRIQQARDIEMHTMSVRAYTAAHAEALRMNREIDAQSKKTAESVNQHTNATRVNNLAMQEAHAMARGLAGSLGALWTTYGALAGMSVGIALGASLRNIAQVGSEVEKQLNFVFALSNQKVDLNSFLNITDASVHSVVEAANAMRALAQNGLTVGESLSVLPTILNLATVGEMDVGQAAIAATGAVSAFGLSIGEAERVADIFAKTAATSNTSVLAMTESMKQASTVSSLFKVSIEDTAAMLGLLAKINITGSAAGTAFTNMLTGMYEPTEKAKKAMEKLGISAFDSAGKMKPVTQFLEELKKATSDLSDTSKSDILGSMFTTRGLKTAVLALENIDEFKKKSEEASGALGFMKGVVKTLEDDTAHAFIRMGVTIQSEFTRAFANAAPEVQKLGLALGDLFKSDSSATHINTLTGEVERDVSAIGNLARNLAILANALVDNIGIVATMVVGLTAYRLAMTYTIVQQTALGTTTTTLSALFATYRTAVAASAAAEIVATEAQAAFRAAHLAGTATTAMYTAAIEAKTAATVAATAAESAFLAVALPGLAMLATAVGVAAAAWLLFRDNSSDASTANTKMENTIKTIGDQLDKEIERLERSNSLWDERNQKFRDGLSIPKAQLDQAKSTMDAIGGQIEKLSGKKITEVVPENFLGKDLINLVTGQTFEVQSLAYQYTVARDNLTALQKQAKQGITVEGGNDVEKTRQRLQKMREDVEKFIKEGTAVGSGGAEDYLEKDASRRAIRTGAEAQKVLADLQKIKVMPFGEGDLAAVKANLDVVAVDMAHLKEKLGAATRTLPKDPDTAAANDAYRAAIREQEDFIKRSNEALTAYEKEQNTRFKIGEQGKLETLENIGAKQIETTQNNLKALAKEYALAEKRPNGQADKQSIQDKMLAEVQASNEKQKQIAKDHQLWLSDLHHNAVKMEIKELEEKGQWVRAAELRYSGETKAMWDQVSAEVAKYGDKFPENIEWLKRMKATQDAAMDTAKVKEATAAFDVLHGAAANLFKGLVADNAGLGIGGIFTAAMEASDKFAASLPDLQKKLADIKKLADANPSDLNAQKAYNEELSKMQGLANHQKTMWAEVGEAISKSLGDAFGNAGKSVGKLLIATQQYGNTRDKINQSGLSEGQKAVALNQATIHTYGDMAGAAKGFFNENSTGYKVMESAEKAFRLVEIAGMYQSLYVTMTTESAKNTAKIPGVIMSFMSYLGPWGAAAAAVAIAAVLGGMSGGGGGVSAKDRQDKAGTGTILGDEKAKSESITKSIEHLDKNSGLGLVHSQAMVNSLRNIEQSMTGLSSSVIRGGLTSASSLVSVGQNSSLLQNAIGGFLGKGPMQSFATALFGGKTSVTDFGLNVNDVSLSDVYNKNVKANAYTDTKTSGGWFSHGSTGSISSDVDPMVTQQVTLILKGLGDSVKMAATSLGVTGADFEAHMNDFVAKIGKVSFKDLKGDEIQKQFAAIFSAIGDDMAKWAVNGLDKFTQTGEGALETLMRITNDFVQVGDVLSSVGQKFKVFGLEAVQLSEDFINLAGGLGKLTEGTKYLVDNIFTESEKLAPVAASLDAAMAALGFSYVKTIAQFDALIHAQDLNTVSGQQTYVALMNLAPAFKKVIDSTKELQDGLYAAAKGALDRLEASIGKEKSVAQAAYDAQIAIIKAQRSSAEKSFNDSKTVLNATIKTATEASSALKSLSSSLKQTLDSMYLVTQQAMRREAAQALITKALDIARSTGVLPKAEDLADALKTVASPADHLFSTFEDYARDMGITTNKISSLKDITDKEAAKQDTVLSVAQKQLLKLEDQYKLTTANFDAQEKAAKDVLDAETTRLDAILDNAKKQLEVANGTYQAVLKLPDALAAFKAALSGMYGSASASTSGGGGGGAGPSVGTMATASPSKFGGTTYLPYNALYTPTPTNPADLASGKIWSEKDMGRAYMAAHTAANNFAFTPIDGSHADGLDYVPKDNYRANLHLGERVKTAKASRDEDSVAEEIRQMRADLNAALLSIAQNTGKTAKLNQKWDGDGMPDVRTYTLA